MYLNSSFTSFPRETRYSARSKYSRVYPHLTVALFPTILKETSCYPRRKRSSSAPVMQASIQWARSNWSNPLHFHLTVLWTKRCSRRIKPSARSMSRIATSITHTLDPARGWPFTAAGMTAGANGRTQSAVRQRPCVLQYRPQRLLELRPRCSRRHLACETNSSGNPAELFAMAGWHPDSSVHQFMAQDRSHLHRHQPFGLA